MNIIRTHVTAIEQLEDFDDEYVYDIVVDENHPYFFANNILVHNSVYTSIESIIEDENDLDNIVEIADAIGACINDSFPEKMSEMFLVNKERGAIIQAGREVVAKRGIFKHKTKKRYALFVVDDEGKRVEKLKIMGMETQRSDTPKWMQEFLKDCLKVVLIEGKGEPELKEKMINFREAFFNRDPWTCGSPSRVSNIKNSIMQIESYLEGHTALKPEIYWVVNAALNHNECLKFYNDNVTPPIIDGDKVQTFYLDVSNNNSNPLNHDKVAISVDMRKPPEWVKELPIDMQRQYNKIFLQKVYSVFDMFDWDLNPPETTFDDIVDW